MKVGRTWFGSRSAYFSTATMLPMLGAISPSAPEGLRPICTQLCEMECPVAHALAERTTARLGNCPASLGSRPTGQLMPLMSVGLKAPGVTPSTTFRSNVSCMVGRSSHQNEDDILRRVLSRDRIGVDHHARGRRLAD